MPLLILGLVFFTLIWMVWALLWLFWPVTLLVAGVILWRGQMRRWERLNAQGDRPSPRTVYSSSGNTAFDDYRAERLNELDEDRGKFGEFLERLRKRKDREEFDRFIADRRQRPSIEGPQGAGA
jgi:hypothetical protein